MRKLLKGKPAAARCRAFTLVEVILAIAIATGLLMVALFFYRQAAELRVKLVEEAERTGTVRLIMDRLTMDLRGACKASATEAGLAGSSDSIRFLTTDLVPRAGWTSGRSGGAAAVSTGLKWVSYGLRSVTEGTNSSISGLTRTEQPPIETLSSTAPKRSESLGFGGATNTSVRSKAEPQAVGETIKYLHFRFYDGATWSESWSGRELPLGVEVTMANEPPDDRNEAEPSSAQGKTKAAAKPDRVQEMPQGFYRRVIYVPAGTRAEASQSGARAGGRSDLRWEDWP